MPEKPRSCQKVRVHASEHTPLGPRKINNFNFRPHTSYKKTRDLGASACRYLLKEAKKGERDDKDIVVDNYRKLSRDFNKVRELVSSQTDYRDGQTSTKYKVYSSKAYVNSRTGEIAALGDENEVDKNVKLNKYLIPVQILSCKDSRGDIGTGLFIPELDNMQVEADAFDKSPLSERAVYNLQDTLDYCKDSTLRQP